MGVRRLSLCTTVCTSGCLSVGQWGQCCSTPGGSGYLCWIMLRARCAWLCNHLISRTRIPTWEKSSVNGELSFIEKPRLCLFNPKLISTDTQHRAAHPWLLFPPVGSFKSQPVLLVPFFPGPGTNASSSLKATFPSGLCPTAGDKGSAPAGAAFPRGAECLPG